MATGASPQHRRRRRLHYGAGDQPGVRRADRLVVRRRLAGHGPTGPVAAHRAGPGPRHADARCAARRRNGAGLPDAAERPSDRDQSRRCASCSGRRSLPDMPKARLRPDAGEGKCPPLPGTRSIDEVPDGPAIIIANEFLDALPIRQLVFVDGAWRERMVDVDAAGQRCGSPPGRRSTHEAEGLRHRSRAPSSSCAPARTSCSPSWPGAPAPLVALFIDYGPAEPAYGDTLQAVHRHA